MKQNRNVDQPVVYKESRSRGNGVSNFLSGVAVLLSTLALLFSGFTAYQVFTLRQTLNATGSTGSVSAINPNQTSAVGNTAPVSPSPGGDSASPLAATPAPNTPTQAPSGSGGIQPGQFVQSAFKNKGQVELLRVNRIPGERDVVNVQVRIRLLRPDKAVGSDSIYMGGTTARNPQTSETYEAVSGESTDSVSLFMMRLQKQTSADAYVWLRVPEGVNTIDIYMPNTQAFTNVPISN
jgi:hypothetical protein